MFLFLGKFKLSPCLQDSSKVISTALKDLQPTSPAQTSIGSSHYSTLNTPQAMFQLSRFSKLGLVGCFFCIKCMSPSFSASQDKASSCMIHHRYNCLSENLPLYRKVNESFMLHSHSTLKSATIIPFITLL